MAQRSSSPFWLFTRLALVLFLEICLVLLFVSPDFAREATKQEASWIVAEMGAAAEREVERRAGIYYKYVVLDTHLEEHLRTLYIPTAEQKARSKGLEALGERQHLWEIVENRLQAFLDMLWWWMRRAAFFTLEVPLALAAVLFAALWGWEQREKKKTSSTPASPLAQGWAVKGGVLIVFGLLMLFLAPVALPPLLVPVFLILTALCTVVGVGNIPKSL